MKQGKRIISAALALVISAAAFQPFGTAADNSRQSAVKAANASEGFASYIKNKANQFVVVKHKQLGGSHYAYTEAVSDSRGFDQPRGDEYNFDKGAEMVLLTYDENDPTKKTEEQLLGTSSGVIRDPDISSDGKRLLYSYKANENDDFHLYEMDLSTRESTQLTFGQGIADTEGKYLPNGKIVFSSTRDIQTVDCWITPVSNLFSCDADGKNIIRLGHDQVHTTYPTVTDDGRVLYTRWDYNDRNQMFIQGVFQMFPDGTNQTEVYGNNTSFPTTVLHTVDIPGAPGKYFSIASGHHVTQCGKLCIIDTNVDRNDYREETENAGQGKPGVKYAVSFVGDDKGNKPDYTYNFDKYGQSGWVYKYPAAISENELFVSLVKNPSTGDGYIARNSRFGVYYTYIKADGSAEYTLMSDYSSKYGAGASQIVPVPKQDEPDFSRPSMVNYAKNTGTYYVGNVYDGEAVKELKAPVYNTDGTIKTPGEVDALRVVELEFRTSAIGSATQDGTDGGGGGPTTPPSTGRGSWDVKRILGIVDVEPDGSALFEVPSETPVYFQLLNKDGIVLQTMRSWSTLMPGESFSCVGCHENKNSVPPSAASTTMAMKKGVQKLKKESWMNADNSAYKGDYDPYNNSIGFSYMKEVQPVFDKSCVSCHNNTDIAYAKVSHSADGAVIFNEREQWSYSTGSEFNTEYAPFGTLNTAPNDVNTVINENTLTLKKTFKANSFQLEKYEFVLNSIITGTVSAKLNGTDIKLEAMTTLNKSLIKDGDNTLEITVKKDAQKGMYYDASLICEDQSTVYWYENEYNVSSWKTSGAGGFGSAGSWGDNKYNSNDIAIKKTFNLTQSQIDSFVLEMRYDEDPVVYINGKKVFQTSGFFDADYKIIDITAAARNALTAGENTIAVSVTNANGNKGIDLGVKVNGSYAISRGEAGWKWYDGIPQKQGNANALVPTGSEWKYTFNTPASNWASENFNDSGWSKGNGIFSDTDRQTTNWNTNNIWIRKTFTIENEQQLAELKNSDIVMDLYYDENPCVYLNGTQFFQTDGYNTDYSAFTVTKEIKDLFKVGVNTIAVSAINTLGARIIDLGLKSVPKNTHPVSLEGTLIDNYTTARQWPVSYLVLTGSTSIGEVNGGPNPLDQPSNPYTTWISTMSGSRIQPAKRYGAINSPVITMLLENHQNLLSEGKITADDIKAIATWIDLCVPLCGSYDELNLWDANSVREYEEKQNKHNYYADMNSASRARLSGTVEDNGEFTFTYSSKGSILASETGIGTLELNVPADLKVGDVVSVKLPEGKKYVAFRLDPRFEEAIVYCPGGTFTYIVPEDAKSVFPRVIQPDEGMRFRHLTMSARIPSDKELKNKNRNLALNPYDLKYGSTSYPHVSASTEYHDSADCRARNAIDGFTTNRRHGQWPYQSWGPELESNGWFNIDFGRTVTVDSIVVYTRADFPHDAHYVSGTLEFSNGTTQPVSFYKTSDAIEFKLDKAVDTTSVKIKDLVVSRSGKDAANNDPWPGFMEVEVYGVETLKAPTSDITPNSITLNKNAVDLKLGTATKPVTVQLTATVDPANYPTELIVWKTGDANIAAVDMNGKVTATGFGTTTITATTHNGKKAECVITVGNKVTGITINPASISDAEVGKTVQLTAAVTPDNATNKTITWTSSDAEVAIVDENGLVTFTGKGTASITAAAADGSGISAVCAVTVTKGVTPPPKPSVVKVTAVAAAKASVKLNIGKKQTIGYTVAPANATDKAVTFKSANIKIATVDAKGVVTAKKAGATTVTITAHDGSGKQAIVKILVNPKKVTKVKAKKSGKKAIKVTFKKISGAKYQIQRRLGKGKWKTLTSKAKKTAYVDKKKLKKGKKYSYRVRAVMTTKFGKVYGAYSKATKAVKR